jgi:protoheme IX farnesyltransferase
MAVLRDYLSLMKIRIDVFITLSGLVGALATARGPISLSHTAWLAAALMLASASAALFNQYFDRDLDLLMTRTRHRALPSGRVRSREVVLIGGVLGLAGLGLAAFAFHPIVALHLFLGAFVYAVVYTVWLKRRSWVNIVIGGLAGSFAILAGGASVRPEFCLPPLFLALVMFFWTPSHFWSLALAHREDYARAGIPMLPVVVGASRTARAILINTGFLVLSSLVPYAMGALGPVYLIGALSAGSYFLAQNIRLIRSPSQELAWTNFKASMVYLTLLLVFTVLDVFWP